MDLLCFCSVLCLLCLCASLFIYALWSPAGKGLTSWLSFVESNCEFVSISDLCTLTYFPSEYMQVSEKTAEHCEWPEKV